MADTVGKCRAHGDGCDEVYALYASERREMIQLEYARRVLAYDEFAQQIIALFDSYKDKVKVAYRLKSMDSLKRKYTRTVKEDLGMLESSEDCRADFIYHDPFGTIPLVYETDYSSGTTRIDRSHCGPRRNSIYDIAGIRIILQNDDFGAQDALNVLNGLGAAVFYGGGGYLNVFPYSEAASLETYFVVNHVETVVEVQIMNQKDHESVERGYLHDKDISLLQEAFKEIPAIFTNQNHENSRHLEINERYDEEFARHEPFMRQVVDILTSSKMTEGAEVISRMKSIDSLKKKSIELNAYGEYKYSSVFGYALRINYKYGGEECCDYEFDDDAISDFAGVRLIVDDDLYDRLVFSGYYSIDTVFVDSDITVFSIDIPRSVAYLRETDRFYSMHNFVAVNPEGLMVEIQIVKKDDHERIEDWYKKQ